MSSMMIPSSIVMMPDNSLIKAVFLFLISSNSKTSSILYSFVKGEIQEQLVLYSQLIHIS